MTEKFDSALKSLSESEGKYRQLFELESDAIFLIDNETGNILEVNEAACDLYGYSHAQFLTMKHTDVSAEPEETRRVTLEWKPFVPVRWHCKSDGTVFPVEISARHFIWKGRPAHIAAIRDITARMHADEALRESEERYRSLVENNPDAVYSFDLKGSFLSVNDSVCRITGYSREELMQMNFGPMIVTEDAEKVRRHFEKASKGEPEYYETTILCKDGRRVEINVTNMPIIVKDEIIGVYGIAKDITERKQAEKALKESEAKYRLLTEKMTDIVWIQDMNLRTVHVSPSIEAVLGFTPEERLAQNVTEQLTSTSMTVVLDVMAKEFALEQEGRADPDRKINLELEYYHKDGSTRWLENVMSGIRDDKEVLTGLHGVSRDITRRKKAEEALRESEENKKRSIENLRKALGATVQAMAVMVESRDPYTAGHQRRVSDLARAIAGEMEIESHQIDALRMASAIHDIGKIAVPSEILSKPTKLTDLEFSLIKSHSKVGYDILKEIEFPGPVAKIVLDHHERIDGSGYPNGLTGENILIESKILAVADVVEAIASHRPYRPGLGIDVALDEITKNKGLLFDPQVVEACVMLFREKSYRLNLNGS
jgi:PAS domain S-box-containing protein/putative nucleotidyltransferase with HDIG domain